ncbi:transmembrane protein 208-like isoform X4 [Juglans regia]|uniref:Transmembrane protein 208-like isoform X4 n=1 Tax=Juglans regia TaxID=51240 RepID=A0A6P9EI62_JUGRE|nr:transmembrane protein 208-like isoform X4 [Juglans regia]
MANQGAKKRKEENARHMANLRRIIIACNVIYVLVRMVVFHSSFTWKHWIGLILTSVAYLFPYQQLARMAQPAYADDGELFDGGFDMNTGGVCGYRHLEHISPLVSLGDFCRKVQREMRRMKSLARREKRWRRRCLGASLSRHELGSLLLKCIK